MNEIENLRPEQLPDIELVNRIISGEHRLFEIIIRSFNQRLYRIGMSILNHDMEVEDAMQVTYIKVFENLNKFEHRSSFDTWLIKIFINQCLKQKKRRLQFDINGELRIQEQLENKTSMKTPSNILVNKELGKALETAVTQLPEKYRMVFILREIEEMSTRETSQVLDIEEVNVKVRLNRAKSMLQQSLKGYLKENLFYFHLDRCNHIVDIVFKHLNLE
jgi:RNA polymerase sigma-70 factor (ECF subfamily)